MENMDLNWKKDMQIGKEMKKIIEILTITEIKNKRKRLNHTKQRIHNKINKNK